MMMKALSIFNFTKANGRQPPGTTHFQQTSAFLRTFFKRAEVNTDEVDNGEETEEEEVTGEGAEDHKEEDTNSIRINRNLLSTGKSI